MAHTRQTQSSDGFSGNPSDKSAECLGTLHSALSICLRGLTAAENELAYLGLNVFTEERLGAGHAGVPLQKLFRCEEIDSALPQRGAL